MPHLKQSSSPLGCIVLALRHPAHPGAGYPLSRNRGRHPRKAAGSPLPNRKPVQTNPPGGHMWWQDHGCFLVWLRNPLKYWHWALHPSSRRWRKGSKTAATICQPDTYSYNTSHLIYPGMISLSQYCQSEHRPHCIQPDAEAFFFLHYTGKNRGAQPLFRKHTGNRAKKFQKNENFTWFFQKTWYNNFRQVDW